MTKLPLSPHCDQGQGRSGVRMLMGKVYKTPSIRIKLQLKQLSIDFGSYRDPLRFILGTIKCVPQIVFFIKRVTMYTYTIQIPIGLLT